MEQTRTSIINELDRTYMKILMRKPKSISYDKLKGKIVSAAQEVLGVEDIVVNEWDSNTIYSMGLHAVVRERRFDEELGNRDSTDNDIGYIRKGRAGFSVASFEYNSWAFSQGVLENFLNSLEKRGLEPSRRNRLGLVYVTPADAIAHNKRIEERETKALYR